MNKKGLVNSMLICLIVITGAVGRGLYETSQNGVLKNNGKKIWCKMQNKGNDYCDQQYPSNQ